MNYSQIKKAVSLRNWVRFVSEMTVYVLAVLSSIIGRSVMALALAVANGYVGSLAFADKFAIRFFKAVMSANPSLDKVMGMHQAHASAHWSGIVIMVMLDMCIFIFGFAPAIKYKGATGQDKLLNLEPISLAMAVLSALLGGVGFIDMDRSINGGSAIEIFFGFIFASVAPILLYFLTKYIKVADTELVSSVTNWVTASLKSELSEVSTLPNAKRQTPQPTTQQPKREAVVGTTFDFADIENSLNKFRNN